MLISLAQREEATDTSLFTFSHRFYLEVCRTEICKPKKERQAGSCSQTRPHKVSFLVVSFFHCVFDVA